MFSTQIKVDSREAEAELIRIASKLADERPFIKTWGNSVAKKARDNARKKSKGGRFWKSLARSVRVRMITAGAAEISSDHIAAAQKQYGGVIRAKNAAALTIPITPEAEGKRAKEFEAGGRDLFVPRGTNVLGYSEDGEFHGLFALVKQTKRQKAEPWFPEPVEINRLGIIEAEFWLDRQLRG